jgi:trimeric autotransporter adhesin
MKSKGSVLLLRLCVSLSLSLTGMALAQTTQGATNFNASNTSQVVGVTQTASGFGIKASTSSTGGVGAVFGQATGTSGFNNGIWGRTFSPVGVGVRGEGMATTGTSTGVAGFSNVSPNGIGVFGHAIVDGVGVEGAIDSEDNSGIGVFGRAGSECCGTPGVFEQDAAQSGADRDIIIGQILDANKNVERIFNIASNGFFGPRYYAGPSGPTQPSDLFIGGNNHLNVFRVDNTCNVFADGGFHTGGADFAEAIAVRGTKSLYSAGDVLVIDSHSTRKLTRSSEPYSTLVAGIYSTKPGITASPNRLGEMAKNDVPLAVVGIVPCKVTTENGTIQPGDLLVTSSKAGFAMKGTDRNRMVGAVVGKALQPLSAPKGMIQVLVTLQ